MPRLLVVDDDIGVRESLRMVLEPLGEVDLADGVDAALEQVARQGPDLILLDLVMPRRSGLELLVELEAQGSDIPVIVLSATKTVATAVEAMKRGAVDYLTKPFEIEALRMKVAHQLEHRALGRELERLRDQVDERDRFGPLVGRSAAMRDVYRQIEKLAGTQGTVLVTGESGTGKELVARAIHEHSPRRDGPFVAVNCGAIARDLIESELFGHERGAFTGATEKRIGRFEAASGGTLLLDEIGELDPGAQVRLLRVLQERSIDRVGGQGPIPVDVRVIAATHRDLQREMDAGRFRADLFFRIHVLPIALPPLRARREDVAPIARHFLSQLAVRQRRPPLRLEPDATRALERYDWPGNVRELTNFLERAAALCEGDAIGLDALPPALQQAEPGAPPCAAAETGSAESSRTAQDGWRTGRVDLERAVVEFESTLIREALERHGWNQTRAAADLGLTRRVLKLKMDRYALAPPGG